MQRNLRKLIRRVWLAALLVPLLPAGWTSLAAEPTRLAAVLQPFVDAHTIAGAVVLVADTNRILDLEAVGWMDLAAKRRMRTDCLFWVASQSKPITCTALMMLVDEGKLSVDDPVEKYLPEFKDVWVGTKIGQDRMRLTRPGHPALVRHLLSHTSGLPYNSAIEQPTLDLYPLALRVRSYTMTPLLFEPGTRSQYANAGINTAGRIVEVVSGMPFAEFLDERIFKPLGMKDTTFWPGASQLKRLAKTYQPNATKDGLEECQIHRLRYPLDDRSRQPVPGSGLFSTATDLSRFYRMLANHGAFAGKRFLSENAVQQMTSDQTGALHKNYGFGITLTGPSVGHGGSYNTLSLFDRDHKLITIFLGQHTDWIRNGKTIIPAFRQAATAAFAPASGRTE